MKKFILILTLLLTVSTITKTFALPNFWFSGTAYNQLGQIIVSPSNVDVFVKINDGINIFTETHTGISVSPFGMFDVNVGTVGSGLSTILMKANTSINVQVRLGSGPWVTVIGQPLMTYTASSYVAPGSILLGITGVSAGTYGNSTNVAQFTVTSDGRITSASNVPIAFPAEVDGSVTNELNTSMSWDNATNTIGVVDAGGTKSVVITGFLETETDPIFAASPASGITAGNITNWNTAFGWGNHATAGYLTSYTETDPIWTAAEPSYGNLGQAETITANWVNTANPWADNEVADNLTIDGGTITNTNITPGTGTITANAISAGTYGINITGNAATATTANAVANALTIGTGLSGTAATYNGSAAVTVSLPNVGTAGTYGSASSVPVITTDAQGRVTGVGSAPIAISPGSMSLTTNHIYVGNAGLAQDVAMSGDVAIIASGATTIQPGVVTNAKLANPSLTVTAGTGLSGGGSVSLGGSTILSMPNVGTAGTYGSTTQVPVFTTDAQGRVSAVTNTAIAFPAEVDGSITNELNSSMSWDNATNTVGVVDAGGTKSVVITGFLETETDPVSGAVNGIIKSNGSAVFSAAIAGTDYLAPSAIGVTVQGFDADLSGLSALNSTTTANRLVASSGVANGYTLIPAPTTNGEVLTFNGTSFAWTIPASVVESDPQVSSSTTNRIPKWNGTTLVDGIITDNGTTASVAGSISVSNSFSLLESVGGTYYSTFAAGDQNANITYRLPTTPPAAGNVLKADTLVPTNLVWAAPFTGGAFQLAYHDYIVAGNFTLDNTYDIVELDGSPATFTVSMPAPVLGKIVFIYNNTSVNATILGNPLQKQTGTILFCDGTNWHRMF